MIVSGGFLFSQVLSQYQKNYFLLRRRLGLAGTLLTWTSVTITR